MIDPLFGFYQAFDKKITNKLTAFAETIPRGHHPHWNFHEEEFSRHDWRVEPKETLQALYKQRATAIREKYDHIIISYTGGADSHNAALSFVQNNLRIDALVNRFCGNRIDTANTEKCPQNEANESVWATVPQYKKLLHKQQDLKLTRWDWTEHLHREWEQNKKNVYELNHISPYSILKKKLLDICGAPLKEKIAVVYGCDKPRIIFERGRFFFLFLDDIVHNNSSWTDQLETGIDCTCEFFYWSPSAARLLIKQAHLVKKWFKENPKFMFLLNSFGSRRELYNNIVNHIIYPYHDSGIWQVAKKNNSFFQETEEWWFRDANNSFLNWQKLEDDMHHEISVMYKHSEHKTTLLQECGRFKLPGCYSKAYDLGS